MIDVFRIGFINIAFAMSGAFALVGCAVLHIQTTNKDDVEVKRGVGIVSVAVTPSRGPTVIESKTLGVINGLEGFSVGYHSATVAVFSDQNCQLILWIKTNEQLQQLNELLNDRTDICVVNPNQPTREKP